MRRPRIHGELLDRSHIEMFESGIHRSSWHNDNVDIFPDSVFMRPAELKNLLEECGIKTITMATCEGLSGHLVEETNSMCMNDELRDAWINLLLKTCEEPSALSLGEHILYVGMTK